MTSGVDREYYERRLREERERALRAADAASAAAHRELAAAYEKLLGSGSTVCNESMLAAA